MAAPKPVKPTPPPPTFLVATLTIEKIKNIFVIVAIIIVVGWFFFTFILVGAGNFSKNLKITQSLRIDSTPTCDTNQFLANKCDLKYRLDVTNTGNNNVYVDSVLTTIWQIPIARLPADSINIDFNRFATDTQTEPIYKGFVHNSNLTGCYSPKSETGSDFDFIVPIAGQKAVLISSVFYCHDTRCLFIKDTFVINNNYTWKLSCVPDKEE